MSTDAGAFFQLDLRESSVQWQIQVFSCLLEAGWRFDDNGKVVCLPLGDADQYEWDNLDTDRHRDIWDLFLRKIQLGETLGVVITWSDTMIGGEFLIEKSGLLKFSASINRRRLVDTGASDVSWYLEKLLLPLDAQKNAVTSWEWKDIYE